MKKIVSIFLGVLFSHRPKKNLLHSTFCRCRRRDYSGRYVQCVHLFVVVVVMVVVLVLYTTLKCGFFSVEKKLKKKGWVDKMAGYIWWWWWWCWYVKKCSFTLFVYLFDIYLLSLTLLHADTHTQFWLMMMMIIMMIIIAICL